MKRTKTGNDAPQRQMQGVYHANPHIVKAHGDILHGNKTPLNADNSNGKGKGNGNGTHILHPGKHNGGGVSLNLGDSEDSDFERIN